MTSNGGVATHGNIVVNTNVSNDGIPILHEDVCEICVAILLKADRSCCVILVRNRERTVLSHRITKAGISPVVCSVIIAVVSNGGKHDHDSIAGVLAVGELIGEHISLHGTIIGKREPCKQHRDKNLVTKTDNQAGVSDEVR